MFEISVIFYLILSYTITLRLNKKVLISDWAINFFLTSISINIVIVEILHFFKSLNNPILFLLIQGALISVLFLLITDPGHLVFKEKLSGFNIKLPKWGVPEIAQSAIIFSVFILTFYVGFQSPINNSDSLHTHLARIFYWLQHNSLENWNAIVKTQISYPINISIQGLWVFLLSREEMFFFLFPWFALVVSIIMIYKISIVLGAKPIGALTTGLISLSFPVVLLQTFSYQGDVFIATLALCATYYLLLYIKYQSKLSLYISIVIISISIGAKQTILLYIPLFVLVIFILFIKKKIAPRLLLNIFGIFIASFMLFSSFKFMQNSLEKTYNVAPMVDPGFYNNLTTMNEKPIQGYITNGLRYLYQAFSLDGVTGQSFLNLNAMRIDLFKRLSKYLTVDLEANQFLSEPDTPFSYNLRTAINEDSAWFGIISLPVILITLAITFLSRDNLRIYYLIFSLILLLLFIFGQVVMKGGWGPNRGRYLIIAIFMIMPLVSFIFPKNRIAGIAVATILTIFAVYLSASILIFNDSRPLMNQLELEIFRETYVNKIEVTNIFNSQYRIKLYRLSNDLIKTASTRTSMHKSGYYDALFFQNSRNIKNIEFINNHIDENQPLYLDFKKTVLEYALFGRNKTRDLFPVRDLEDVKRDSYVIVSKDILQNLDDFILIAENDDYAILFRQ